MSSWKQTLFLGGAVLLLAACSDATAPTAQLRDGAAAAAAQKGPPGGVKTPETGLLECRSGYVVNSGIIICLDELQ